MKPIEETYKDVEKLIVSLGWKAVRKYGGDLDDYVSAGNEAFVDAFVTFDPTEATSFSTWVWWKIRGAIGSEVNSNSIEARTYTGDDGINYLPSPSKFNYELFLDELGYDARVVAMMMVESSEDFEFFLHHSDAASIVRGGLYNRLKALGWSVARVVESFSEIREALE